MTSSVLQRIAAGDPTAVRECIDEFSALVWSLARRLSRTPADAEDATQEIFLDIWRSAGRFDPCQGSDRVFIAMIARRRLIDRLRQMKREPPMDSIEALEFIPSRGPETTAENSAEVAQANRVLAKLPPAQREVLELSLWYGLSQSEIATKLHLPLGTVKTFMRRGLMEARELMNITEKGDSARI